jgi:hypothetical protein
MYFSERVMCDCIYSHTFLCLIIQTGVSRTGAVVNSVITFFVTGCASSGGTIRGSGFGRFVGVTGIKFSLMKTRLPGSGAAWKTRALRCTRSQASCWGLVSNLQFFSENYTWWSLKDPAETTGFTGFSPHF